MKWRDRQIRSLAPLIGGFLLLLSIMAAVLILTVQRHETVGRVLHTLAVQSQLDRVQMLATDAETGQRGYLLTGRLSYLDPYEIAKSEIGPAIDVLAGQISDTPAQQSAFGNLRKLVANKVTELQQTIDLRSSGHADAALAVVDKDYGNGLMTAIRRVICEMQGREIRLFEQRSAYAASLYQLGTLTLIGSMLLMAVIGAISVLDAHRKITALRRSHRQLELEITEREIAENRLRQLQKMEAIGQLTGGIAHDFNNMLAIVVGFLGLARRRLSDSDTPAALECVDKATEGANRAVELTSRLLTFSRQQPLEPQVLDANRLVSSMSELLHRTIGELIRIETVLASGLWQVFADPTQVESAILNLAVNARDAMPCGGKLTIETGNVDLDERYAAAHSEVTAGQYAMISVSDTGCGMPLEVLGRAFDPFYTTKDVGKGTGLGLSQVFGFVKQSGGHVKIYSEIDQGTTVKIYLPRHTSLVAASFGEGPRSVTSPQGRAEEVILVVEDDVKVLRMTVASLRELGYTVVHTASPGDALEKVQQLPGVSLLFTDVVMPEMNGRELAERALRHKPGLKTVYTTGYTRNAVVHNGIVDAGAAFLAKPFTLPQLASKVRQALDA